MELSEGQGVFQDRAPWGEFQQESELSGGFLSGPWANANIHSPARTLLHFSVVSQETHNMLMGIS